MLQLARWASIRENASFARPAGDRGMLDGLTLPRCWMPMVSRYQQHALQHSWRQQAWTYNLSTPSTALFIC